jgi:hypothetical protein
MRTFLIQQLKELEARTGIKQLIWLQQKPDAKEQVNILIDSMLKICKQYSYIPEDKQKVIIERGIMEDREFDSLNARTIGKWFDLYGGKYFEPGTQYEVIDPGEISQDTQKMINEFQASLSQGPKEVPAVSRYEILKAKDRPKQEAVSRGYKYSTEEDHRLSDLRVEYSRTYHHLHTGKKLPNWISWEEFLQTKQ